jgi:hypothetical protein
MSHCPFVKSPLLFSNHRLFTRAERIFVEEFFFCENTADTYANRQDAKFAKSFNPKLLGVLGD